MNDTARQFRDFFVSLKLTVVLLALSIVLVFAATLDQVNLGVWAVQEKYFRSFFVLWRVGDVPVPVFPGGYLIGGLLLINLLAAHIYRFKMTSRKLGIFLTHAGLILLLVGELISGLLQQEFQLRVKEGETKNFFESYRSNEVVVIDTTDPKYDDVVAIPEKLIAHGDSIQNPKLPFRVVTKAYYPNAMLQMRRDAPNAPASQATAGIGPQIALTPLPITYKQDDRNWPAAYVELLGPDGSLGTWLLSTQLPSIQTFNYAGRAWRIGFRVQREYVPFSLTLLKFRFDRYPGTEIAKNFSSQVRITAEGKNDREVLIYMNNPLRYEGLTFYQAGYDPDEHGTILQVVHNPSWRLPYIACSMMALGLVLQFGLHLAGFLRKRRAAAA